MNALAKGVVALAFSAGLGMSVPAALPIVAIQGSQTVTLDAPGWSLQKICEAISQQVGTKVEAHGDCVTDHLIVRVNNVPWTVLQQKLAWAEYGQWTISNNVLTIERDPKLVQARIQQNITDLAGRIANEFQHDKVAALPFDAKQIARDFKTIAKKYGPDQGSGNGTNQYPDQGVQSAFLELRQRLPFAVQFKRIIETLSPMDLASIPIGGRVVFSNQPTILQVPMPDATKQAIQSAIDQNDQLVKALNAEGLDVSGITGGFAPVSSNDFIFVSVRNNFGFNLLAHIRIFDSTGKLLIGYSQPIGIPTATNNQSDTNGPVTRCKLSPEASEMFAQIANPATDTPSPELLQTLREPLKVDPLYFAVNPILNAIAPNKNIVVSNDWLMFAPELIFSRNGSASVPSNYFSTDPMSTITDQNETDGWLCLRTSYNTNSLFQTIPRPSYSNLVENISPDGVFDFVTSMRYANTLGPDGSLITAYGTCFLKALGFGQNPLDTRKQEWDLFRLVGSLSNVQISQAESLQGLRLSTMASQSKDIVKSILFFRFMDPLYSAFGGNSSLQRTEATIYNEPTFAFAQTIPDGVLQIVAKKTTQVSFPSTPPGSNQSGEQSGDITDLASFMEEAKVDPAIGYDFNQMKLYPDFNYIILISFPGTKLAPILTIFDTRSYNKKTYAGLSDFPAPLRDQVESELKRLDNPGSGG